jgi:hypothetical protein
MVDGRCGQKTMKAIQTFQLKHFGWKGADGRVDPDKQTIAKLNELAGGSSASPAHLGVSQLGTAPPGRIARIIGLMNQSFSYINAARANLLIARNVVDTTDGPTTVGRTRAERMLLVNRHFDVDAHPKSMRSGVLRQILNTFDMMLSVFTRPGPLWGVAVFELDPIGYKNGEMAYTSFQGFHRSGQTKTEKGKKLRVDSIYLCEGIDVVSDEVCAMTVVHELAHFVGFPVVITDFASGWYDHPRMKTLVPWQKLRNGQNYGNFAFDARHGRRPVGWGA